MRLRTAAPGGRESAARSGPEIAGWPAAAGGPRPPRRRWIWITVAIVTAIAVVGPVGTRVWLKTRQSLQRPVMIGRPVTAVEVTAPGDSVAVSPGPAGRVTIGRTLTWVFGMPRLRQTWNGTTMVIRVTCPRPGAFEDCAAQLDLRVPAGVAVRADVASGDVTLVGLTGPVRLVATSGDVTLADLTGPVWCRVTSGDISGNGLGSAPARVAASSGDVSLAFVGRPRQVNVTAGTGDVSVQVPPGSRYRVSGAAGTGSRSIAGGLADSRASAQITATSRTGSVTVGYPG
jgi:Putative adhesin